MFFNNKWHRTDVHSGHDTNYKRLASGVRFTNWGDMVRFYHNLRLPY